MQAFVGFAAALHASIVPPVVVSGPVELLDVDVSSAAVVETSTAVSSCPAVVPVLDVSPDVTISTAPVEPLVDEPVVVGSTSAVVSPVEPLDPPVVGPTDPPVSVPPSLPITVDELADDEPSLSSLHPTANSQHPVIMVE